MGLPYFYIPSFQKDDPEIYLNEDNSRHLVQVLRMSAGEDLHLTDGKGNLLTGTLRDANKRKSLVVLKSAAFLPPPERKVTIAISPLKNASRFEWFLEKAAEIGVSGVIPLMTTRTVRQHLRVDRLQNILISAMLQSQQTWLPDLRPPSPFNDVINESGRDRRMIAWLGDPEKAVYPAPDKRDTLVLIGPEGDFTPEEAASALDRQYIPVTLGKNRLRTETAGVVTAALLCIG